jgi:hypothetical protein
MLDLEVETEDRAGMEPGAWCLDLGVSLVFGSWIFEAGLLKSLT